MKKVLLLSNMYPSSQFPSYGVFVKNFENLLVEHDVTYNKVVLTNSKSRYLKLIKYLLFFLRTFVTLLINKYEIVYIHYASITSIPVLWASKFKTFVIYTNVHGTDVMPSTDKEKKLEKNTKKICEKSDKIIVPSDYFKELIGKRYDIEGAEVITYPSGGIDQTVFYPNKRTKKTAGNNQVLTVGFVSRIEHEKGWKTFIDAIIQLKEKELPLEVLIIGEGSQRADMEAYIKQNKLESSIKQLPFVTQEKLNDYYNTMDVFVFPSRKESLGLVGLEAMSCSLPVIGSRIPAIESYVTDNKNGFLFKRDNADELAEKLLNFFALSIEEKAQMQSNALNTSMKYNKTNSKKIFREIFNII